MPVQGSLYSFAEKQIFFSITFYFFTNPDFFYANDEYKVALFQTVVYLWVIEEHITALCISYGPSIKINFRNIILNKTWWQYVPCS